MNNKSLWFLGPKAENAPIFKELLNVIVTDYFHWRKNYFPEDPFLISKKEQHSFDPSYDVLCQNVDEFLAALRRNFPFYNPRYIGHMLSDITMPSLLGYFGGLLYNPNNVTTEAAPVTTEWEIDACNQILKMIGFKEPPMPPKSTQAREWSNYKKYLKEEFGWAHITSGGTIANIEALWVARCVKYLPLSIKDVVINRVPQLNIELKTPSGEIKSISQFDNFELINIKPSESIYLLSKYIESYKKFKYDNQAIDDTSLQFVSKEAMDILKDSEYSIANNMGKLLSEYPLAIFVSGTAHYSVHKAADLLGIGRKNIHFINIKPDFRIDTEDLKTEINNCIENKIAPLAVIGIAGTTEEGAIDPIHKIIDIRKEFEKNNCSFWVHVDAAWGGFAKTILQLEDEQVCRVYLNKIYRKMKGISTTKYCDSEPCLSQIKEQLDFLIKEIKIKKQAVVDASYDDDRSNDENLDTVFEEFSNELFFLEKSDTQTTLEHFLELNESKIQSFPALKKKLLRQKNSRTFNFNDFVENRKQQLRYDLKKLRPLKKVNRYYTISRRELDDITKDIKSKAYDKVIPKLRDFYFNLYDLLNDNFDSDETNRYSKKSITDEYRKEFNLTLEDRIAEYHFLLQYNLKIEEKKTFTFDIEGDDRNFVSAFLAFKYADSVTIDPHKMGYMPYPCGVIAFRNDRIRHLITQDAPYITSSKSSILIHTPPLHSTVDLSKEVYKEEDIKQRPIDAFAPFILEGSKPGAAAAALWLTLKCMSLSVSSYGMLIKDSLLSARSLYTYIKKWNEMQFKLGKAIPYEIMPISDKEPDLNLVVFAIKSRTNHSPKECTIQYMNKLAEKIYDKYTIQVEEGEKTYSYGQSFFLSKTSFNEPLYSYSSLENFFHRNNIKCSPAEYKQHGLIVLRATLMNPYLWEYKINKDFDIIRDFINDLHQTIIDLLYEGSEIQLTEVTNKNGKLILQGDNSTDDLNKQTTIHPSPNNFLATINGTALSVLKQDSSIPSAQAKVVNALTGSVVLNQQFTESLSEQITNSGVYVLHIETEGGALVGQFIVQ